MPMLVVAQGRRRPRRQLVGACRDPVVRGLVAVENRSSELHEPRQSEEQGLISRLRYRPLRLGQSRQTKDGLGFPGAITALARSECSSVRSGPRIVATGLSRIRGLGQFISDVASSS